MLWMVRVQALHGKRSKPARTVAMGYFMIFMTFVICDM
jgi:hypothetical protein